MGNFGFFIIILAFLFLYLVLVRPQKRRQVEQQRMLNDLNVGDEVVTAGGLYGEITELRDDEVLVRIAPTLEVRVARRAIGGVITPPEPDSAPQAEPEPHDGPEPEREPAARSESGPTTER